MPEIPQQPAVCLPCLSGQFWQLCCRSHLRWPCFHSCRELQAAGGGGGAAADVGLAAASNLPPLNELPQAEQDWLEVLTTTDRFFKVRSYSRQCLGRTRLCMKHISLCCLWQNALPKRHTCMYKASVVRPASSMICIGYKCARCHSDACFVHMPRFSP